MLHCWWGLLKFLMKFLLWSRTKSPIKARQLGYSQSFLVPSAFKGLDFVSEGLPSGFRPAGVHTSPMLCQHCVQLCKAPSAPVCVIKTKEQQLTGQRLMAIQFTAHHGQRGEKCSHTLIHHLQAAPREGGCAEILSSLSCFECFRMGAEQGTTARVRGIPLS